MKCPACGSLNHRRYRSPRMRKDVLVRRHRCLDCGEVFTTAEVVITDEMATQIVLLGKLL